MIPKFRAWDKANKEMLNVDVIDFFLREIRVLEDNGSVFSMKFDDIELMQSTGLKDRTCKEIYEGDIVMPVSFGLWIGRVEYLPEKAAWVMKEHNDRYRRDAPVYLSQFEGIKVLGNIYEDPELLEVE